MSERFIVSSVGGFKNGPLRGSSYYVNDTAYNYLVVARFATNKGRPSARCRYLAERYCDDLNAWAASA